MLKYLIVVVCAVVGLGIAVLDMNSPAAAQRPCPEGMKDGNCINPDLANSMRHLGRTAVQPKASQSAPATSVTGDRVTPPTPNYYEQNKGIYSSQPCRSNPLGGGIKC